MRNGFLGSIAALVSGASLALAQAPLPPYPGVSPTTYPMAPMTTSAGESLIPTGIPLESLPTSDPNPGGKAAAPGMWDRISNGVGMRPTDRDLPRSSRGGAAAAAYPSHEEILVAYRLWARGEYLYWWTKDGPAAPPLVSTGPPESFGILGRPGVSTLFGNQPIDYGEFHGARVSAGIWMDEDAHLGLEVTGFALFENSLSQQFASNAVGSPLLARPVFNSVSQEQGVALISAPNVLTGNIKVDTASELWGVEISLLGSEWRGRWFWLDAIAGFRYMELEESLSISNQSTVLPQGTVAFLGNRYGPGSVLTVRDHFRTRNEFYGAQIGWRGEFCYNNFFVNVQGKVALGNTHETVAATGRTALAAGTVNSALPGGLLAVASNSHLYSRDEFSVIPEFTLKLGAYIGKNLNVFVGYNYLYWADVARAANQPDLIVNPAQVPSNLAFGQGGIRLPAAVIRPSHYWAQGFSAGFEVRY